MGFAQATTIARWSFYFDYASPFAYLASTQVERIARKHNADLVYRPFLLGGLFRELGGPLVPIQEMTEQKRSYVRRDMQRWADHWGVPLKFPTAFPLRTVDALRLTLLAKCSPKLIARIMRACWADDEALTLEHLRVCASEADVDPALCNRLSEAKQALIEATHTARKHQVFGTPTFLVGDQLFFGQDRLHFVEAALDARARER